MTEGPDPPTSARVTLVATSKEVAMKERAPHVPPQEMGAITFTNLTREVEIGANSYCLEVAGKRIVLDSGLHPRFEGEQALPQLGLLPDDSVDAVILSHAHQDHLGSIPVLMRRHPRAPVFMTEATR
ncbi:MAG TPA: MBL fold metallo-hydrolase, partial [Chthoniobacteraceae bacterium]|nr:MBL fold metallo-hydrolase [Chthoniobacteraceae bacterium]